MLLDSPIDQYFSFPKNQTKYLKDSRNIKETYQIKRKETFNLKWMDKVIVHF